MAKKAVKKAATKTPRRPVAASKGAKATPRHKKATKKPRAAPKEPEITQPWLADTSAARLCRAVDKSHIGFDAYLEGKSIKPGVVAEAKALDRVWEVAARNRVYRLGGTYNGQRR